MLKNKAISCKYAPVPGIVLACPLSSRFIRWKLLAMTMKYHLPDLLLHCVQLKAQYVFRKQSWKFLWDCRFCHYRANWKGVCRSLAQDCQCSKCHSLRTRIVSSRMECTCYVLPRVLCLFWMVILCLSFPLFVMICFSLPIMQVTGSPMAIWAIEPISA